MKTMLQLAQRALLSLTLVMTAAQAAPLVAHDTLGPGNEFNTGYGWFAGSPGGPMNVAAADRFVAAASGWLDHATLALYAFRTGLPVDHARVRVAVLADEGGKPGAVIDTAWLAIPLPRSGFLEASLFDFDFGGDTQLLAGSPYWLSLTADEAEPAYEIVHTANMQGLTGPHSVRGVPWIPAGTWSEAYAGDIGAARVVLDSEQRTVSEPAHAALAALLGWAVVLRRRRCAAQA